MVLTEGLCPAHMHIVVPVQNQAEISLEGNRCGLCPEPLRCSEGVRGVPSYHQKELPTLLSSHRAWAFLCWTRWHSTHLRAWLLSSFSRILFYS